MKSLGELDRLVMDVIDHLDAFVEDPCSQFSVEDGWQESTVHIPRPAGGFHVASEADAPQLLVPGLFHQPLLGVLTAALQEIVAESFRFRNIGNQILKCPPNTFILSSTLQMYLPESMKGFAHSLTSQGIILRLLLLASCFGQTRHTSQALKMLPSGQFTSSSSGIYQSTCMQNLLHLQLTIWPISQKFVNCIMYMSD
jgi:hypothetical protein